MLNLSDSMLKELRILKRHSDGKMAFGMKIKDKPPVCRTEMLLSVANEFVQKGYATFMDIDKSRVKITKEGEKLVEKFFNRKTYKADKRFNYLAQSK